MSDRTDWLQTQRDESGFTSVDPAPPQAAVGREPTVQDLRVNLMDRELPMFERMRAVFALRNVGGADAVEALGEAFQDSSALLRHEIAYVMGQMGDAHALPILTEVLSKEDEHVMVRHEAAEAMGAIGDESARPVLKKYVDDPNPEVSESCVVALDLLDWMAGGELDNF